jgi:sugar phosphate isomerase/epimerase
LRQVIRVGNDVDLQLLPEPSRSKLPRPSMTLKDLDKIPLAYATPSLGMSSCHTVELKLQAASKAGFRGVEMGFDDLLSHAKRHNPGYKGEEDLPTILKSAGEIRELCKELDLEIICLQPFQDFEGATTDRERQVRFAKADKYLTIMKELGTRMLQVGSTDNPKTSNNYDVIANDLSELCDLAASKSPSCSIAYEPWCWGAHIQTWEEGWDIIQRVNRPNIGINLDTFQVPGREWADPESETGILKGYSERELTAKFEASMDLLAKAIPGEKISYIQISDGLKMQPPIQSGHPAYVEGKPARGQWSHAYRPLPFKNGYLPVITALKGFLETGFRGWTSMEVFEERQQQEDESIPEEYAKEGMEAWKKLVQELQAKE